jgi:hypothetical protein
LSSHLFFKNHYAEESTANPFRDTEHFRLKAGLRTALFVGSSRPGPLEVKMDGAN